MSGLWCQHGEVMKLSIDVWKVLSSITSASLMSLPCFSLQCRIRIGIEMQARCPIQVDLFNTQRCSRYRDLIEPSL